MEFKFTDHVLLRYCERVKDKDSGTDAKQYFITNETRVREEIDKLYLSSELLYKGKLGATERPCVELYGNKNGWVFIVDPKEFFIITLYKIDLEVDDESFNQLYVEKAFQALRDKSAAHIKLCEEMDAEILEAQRDKNANLEEIKILKKHIKVLEESNEAFDTFIRLKQSKKTMSELELKKMADKFCAKDSGTNIGKERI